MFAVHTDVTVLLTALAAVSFIAALYLIVARRDIAAGLAAGVVGLILLLFGH